jgi:hydroxyacylglutathione hydrolase
VEFAIEPLQDGQRLSLGEVTLEILATPGHTPESICVVVYEHPDDAVPYGLLTCDTLFVGDVGDRMRASSGLPADTLARKLCRSLHDKLLPRPDATPRDSRCGPTTSSSTPAVAAEQLRQSRES